MTIGILGKKLGMTQLFDDDGRVSPCTVLSCGPCRVLQVKVKDLMELPEAHRSASRNLGKKRGKTERPRRADGYYAIQLGYDEKSVKAAKKPMVGHVAKAGAPEGKSYRFIREIRWSELPPYEQGQELGAEVLSGLKKVDVTGTTKGRGTAGWIKRWNFRRQPMSHGTKKVHRHAGSLGRTYTTAKGLTKGHKMAGHYGVEQVTIQSLDVVRVDAERNLVYIRGAVPGPNQGYVMVRKAVKYKG